MTDTWPSADLIVLDAFQTTAVPCLPWEGRVNMASRTFSLLPRKENLGSQAGQASPLTDRLSLCVWAHWPEKNTCMWVLLPQTNREPHLWVLVDMLLHPHPRVFGVPCSWHHSITEIWECAIKLRTRSIKIYGCWPQRNAEKSWFFSIALHLSLQGRKLFVF